MIVTKVDDIYNVRMPPAVATVLRTFAVGVNLGFSGVDAVLECLNMRGYIARLTAIMIFPPSIALAIIGSAMGRVWIRKGSGAMFVEAALPNLLRLGFLTYPLVTTVAFVRFPGRHPPHSLTPLTCPCPSRLQSSFSIAVCVIDVRVSRPHCRKPSPATNSPKANGSRRMCRSNATLPSTMKCVLFHGWRSPSIQLGSYSYTAGSSSLRAMPSSKLGPQCSAVQPLFSTENIRSTFFGGR